MLHALTSEAKNATVQSKSPFEPQPGRKLHPHSFSATGEYALNCAGSAASVRSLEAQQRQTLTGMQSMYGNQAVLRMLRSPQQVARMPALRPSHSVMLQRKCACSGSSESTGECEECKARREAGLQRSVANQGASPAVNTTPPIVHDVLSSSGQPLDVGTRAFIEPRFGHDFSQVRVHNDARAAESARAVNALAYTVGNNVVFGAGQYAPGTREGKRLMAHELTHVVQQNRYAGVSPAKMPISVPGDIGEQEAEYVEKTIDHGNKINELSSYNTHALPYSIQHRVDPANVTCHDTGLTHPDLTGAEAVTAIQDAEADAIELAARAENLLFINLLLTEAGESVDVAFDTILTEELGLTLTNPAHFPLIRQQADRFQRVRELLESGFLRYLCRAETVELVGCSAAPCAPNFARSCPANRLIALCQNFWDDPAQRSATILHEPFHILFTMQFHQNNALRRADASCFESFALRVAGRGAFLSCVGHMDG